MSKYTKKELKDMFRDQFRRYKAETGPLAPDELKGLNKWADNGNSPYDNPYSLYGEDGRPMDFIDAMRTDEDMRRNPVNYHFGGPCDDAGNDTASF